MIESILVVITMAVLVEAIVEGIKGALSVWAWAALGLAAVLCPLAGIDIFATMGVPLKVPVLGSVLTGLVVGRGANVVYNVWEKSQRATPHDDSA